MRIGAAMFANHFPLSLAEPWVTADMDAPWIDTVVHLSPS